MVYISREIRRCFILSALLALGFTPTLASAADISEMRAGVSSLDPFPPFPSDGCGMAAGERFTTLFFDADRHDLAHPAMTGRLDQMVDQLRKDGGFLLLEGVIDQDEATRGFNSDLDRRRAEWVRDEAVRRGVAPNRIWLKASGVLALMTSMAPGAAKAESRRVTAFLSNFGAACGMQVRQRQVDWLRRNCLFSSAPKPERECDLALDAMLRPSR